MTFDQLRYIKMELEYIKSCKTKADYDTFNQAAAEYNEGIGALNGFIQLRNKKFVPQISDADILHKIDTAVDKLRLSQATMSRIKNPDQTLSPQVAQLSEATAQALKASMEQQAWLKPYLSKNKTGRRAMLAGKITWFGIPLN